MAVITYYCAIFALLLHHYYSLLHCNNELIFTYYKSLLHIIAYYCILLLFPNTCHSHLILTGPRASTPEINGNPRWWCVWALSQNLKPTRLRDDSKSLIMCTKGRSPQQSWNRWTWELFWPSVPITQKTAESIEDIRGHHDYAASSARQGPGSWGWIWRVLVQNSFEAWGWLYIQVSVWGLFVSIFWRCSLLSKMAWSFTCVPM